MDVDDIRIFVKETRKANGLTQEELAKSAGVSTNTLSAFETGIRNTSVENLSYVLNALGYAFDIRPYVERPWMKPRGSEHSDLGKSW